VRGRQVRDLILNWLDGGIAAHGGRLSGCL
jgi:hypothetical protein